MDKLRLRSDVVSIIIRCNKISHMKPVQVYNDYCMQEYFFSLPVTMKMRTSYHTITAYNCRLYTIREAYVIPSVNPSAYRLNYRLNL